MAQGLTCLVQSVNQALDQNKCSVIVIHREAINEYTSIWRIRCIVQFKKLGKVIGGVMNKCLLWAEA